MEMRGYFIGPMPVQDFLDQYLAKAQEPTPALCGLFEGGIESKQEKEMYPAFIQKITESGLIPGFKIIDTSSHADLYSKKGKKFKPDPSMYRESVDTDERPTQFDELELNFEFKRGSSCDPFADPKDEDKKGERNSADSTTTQDYHMNGMAEEQRRDQITERRKGLHFETSTAGGKDARGQLTTYATEWFGRQHRLFGFTVFILHPYVRFILWDRSASIVTERFNVDTHPQYLAEFLWRFIHLSDLGRGHDPTVRKATEEEAQLAKQHLSEWKDVSERPPYVFRVPDGDQEREFIGWGSLADPDSLIGRATRAYPVYEKAAGKTYFLKDSWRSVTTEKEAEILQELNVSGVRNVPRLVCGGDLPGHQTLSHIVGVEEDSEFYDSTTGLKRPWWKCGRYFVIGRVHHRFVEDFLGQHLDRFQSSRQLLQATYDAFIAHEDAFVKCRILHRDVSAKNVMMTWDGHGILNDWDLAKRVPEFPSPEKARMPHRTGTWQFISAKLLQNPGKRHLVQDDMESFVWVVLYHAFRYLQHTATDMAETLMADLFDESLNRKGLSEGGRNKEFFFKNSVPYVGTNFCFQESRPLQLWYQSVSFAVRQWHDYESRILNEINPPQVQLLDEDDPAFTEPEPAPVPFGRLVFADHTKLRQKWESILARSDWPDKEQTVDHTPEGTTSSEPEPKHANHEELGSRYIPGKSSASKRTLEDDMQENGWTAKKSRTSSSLCIPGNGQMLGQMTKKSRASSSNHRRL